MLSNYSFNAERQGETFFLDLNLTYEFQIKEIKEIAQTEEDSKLINKLSEIIPKGLIEELDEDSVTQIKIDLMRQYTNYLEEQNNNLQRENYHLKNPGQVPEDDIPF